MPIIAYLVGRSIHLQPTRYRCTRCTTHYCTHVHSAVLDSSGGRGSCAIFDDDSGNNQIRRRKHQCWSFCLAKRSLGHYASQSRISGLVSAPTSHL